LIGWPGLHESGVRLATRAKGIFKPAGWEHALSVRQTLGSPYADEDPSYRPDGTWSYRYHQEGRGSSATTDYTNEALDKCIKDKVPVIVFRQEALAPVKYRLLGIALAIGWEDGFYTFEGFSPEGACGDLGTGPSGPVSLEDARRRVERVLAERQGQPAFRATLVDAYEGQCAITDCRVLAILEAAHVVPFLGLHTNELANGLLLRADVHTLFDRGLIRIDSLSLSIELAESIRGSEYDEYHGKILALPSCVAVESFRANLEARDQLMKPNGG
jgi:hypothetical protein